MQLFTFVNKSFDLGLQRSRICWRAQRSSGGGKQSSVFTLKLSEFSLHDTT
jgi:hypothetical protein